MNHVIEGKTYNLMMKLFLHQESNIYLIRLTKRQPYSDDETQHSRAANPLIKLSPAPVAQQPTIKGAPKGPLEEAQQPEPYIAASPTRPPTW